MPRLPKSLIALVLVLLAGPALAQDGALATEYPRVSQIIGSHVHNDRNESIGKIEDVVVRPDGRGPLAIIQVPGIPELEARRVAIPVHDMRWNAAGQRIMIPGTTQRHLLNEPAFNF